MRDSRGLLYSTALHGFILLLLMVGLPDFLQHPLDEEPEAISVDILPIAPKSNVKPQEKPPEKITKPLADRTTDRKPVIDAQKEESKPPPSEEKPKKEDPKPEVKPDVVKPDIIKPKPPKKPEKPKKETPKPKEDEFSKLLSSMQTQHKSEESPKPTQARTDPKARPTRSQVYDSSQPLSMSQMDAIRSQIERCWNAPVGGRDAQNLIVTLHLELTEDGSVTTVELSKGQGRYNSDSFFQAAADAAVRAVKRCSPIKNLPADKYGTWRSMELNFNPHDML